MPLCVAIGCYNKSYRKAKGQKNVEQDVEITFHRFPKDEARKLTWLKNMGLRDECLPKSPHLCSLHFSESSFDHSSLMRTRLKENAIPILNISEIESTEKKIEIPSVSNTSIKTSLTVNDNDLTTSQDKNETELIETFHYVSNEIPMKTSLKEFGFNDELTFKSEITKQQTSKHYREDDNYSGNEIMSKRHYSTDQRLEDSPRKKLLRKALFHQKEHFQRQIRTLKQRNKRQEKRIATFNAILKDLKQKSLLVDKHTDILETIAG